MPATAQLDQLVSSETAEGYGTITIRVVVLQKGWPLRPRRGTQTAFLR
jgi:hypothetical protein